MKNRVISAFVLGFLSLIFPIILVCDLFHRNIWKSSILSDTEDDQRSLIERWWLEPCEKIIDWGWNQRHIKEVKTSAIHSHDVREDYVWSDAFSRNFHEHHWVQRHTCWTDGCDGAQINQSPEMNYKDWNNKVSAFRQDHPYFKIKSSGLPTKT